MRVRHAIDDVVDEPFTSCFQGGACYRLFGHALEAARIFRGEVLSLSRENLDFELGRVPGRGRLAKAIRDALARWPALGCFLDDGGVELDNNAVERAIRPIALGRKNHLFADSDGGGERWATVCSLLATAKLNDVELYSDLKDVLQRWADGHPMSRLDALLPWNWTALHVKQ